MNDSNSNLLDLQKKIFHYEKIYYLLTVFAHFPFLKFSYLNLKLLMLFWKNSIIWTNFKHHRSPKFNKIHNDFFFKFKGPTRAGQFSFSENTRVYDRVTFCKIIRLLFMFNFFTLNEKSKLNHNYNLFFGRIGKAVLWLNNNRFISVWQNAISFLYNIFYFNIEMLMFGSLVFKNQVLAFNWKQFANEINLWNLFLPFFIFKTNVFKKKIEFFYKKIAMTGLNFFVILDTFYHYKNLYYFQKHNFFTLGLTNASLSPWKITYAVPALMNNFFTQLFFLKVFLFLKRFAKTHRINFYKNLWFNVLYNKSLSKM